MVKSMTGFGSAVTETDKYTLSIEVKSLNSKFQEINIKFPKEFSDLELELRNQISKILERGKINVSIDKQWKPGAKPRSMVNLPVLKQYYKDLLESARELHADTTELFKLALHLPDSLLSPEMEDSPDAEADRFLLTSTLQLALDRADKFRSDEGLGLAKKMTENIFKIASTLTEIEALDPQRIQQTRQRIISRLNELSGDVKFDPNRFEQELVYYIEKLDINEEKVRLRSHLNYFMESLEQKGGENAGKRLGFISQEIGREINTIGSKVNDAAIQRMVVTMKEELEKIKEQSLNIL